MKDGRIPKLIVVDGLSGSGKTTTCRWLEQQFQQRHISTSAFYEADVPHPLHWWHYWDGVRHHGPDFEHVLPADYMNASVERWKDFAVAIQGSGDIVIVEGVLYCLAIGFFVQGDTPAQQLFTYNQRVENVIRPLAPLLIYLRQDTLETHARSVWASRGAAITHELIVNMERTPYLRRRDLRGFDGVIRLWQETQRLMDALFAQQTIRKLAIEVTRGDWTSYYQQIYASLFDDQGSLPE
jgi:hypothetical protein